MKIIVSQQDKRIKIAFHQGGVVDNYTIDKAEEFLVCIDKLTKKHQTAKIGWKSAKLEFHNIGVLTERVIRAIMLGFRFYFNSPPK